jgi:putative hydrolase of the HAD superfamily
MELKAVVFDMDDTLIDWSRNEPNWEEIARDHMQGVYKYAVDQLHMSIEDEELFMKRMWDRILDDWAKASRTLMAPHIGTAMVEVLNEMGANGTDIEMSELLDAYGWGPLPGVAAFEDALEVLPDLKNRGLKVGLVTNAAQPIEMRERELKAYGLNDYIDEYCRITAADVGYLKPHPEIFRRALDCLGAVPEQVVFVGDSVGADIVGAQGVGMKAVLRRIESRHQQQQQEITEDSTPDAQIDTLHDLYQHLDGWYPDWRKV